MQSVVWPPDDTEKLHITPFNGLTFFVTTFRPNELISLLLRTTRVSNSESKQFFWYSPFYFNQTEGENKPLNPNPDHNTFLFLIFGNLL